MQIDTNHWQGTQNRTGKSTDNSNLQPLSKNPFGGWRSSSGAGSMGPGLRDQGFSGLKSNFSRNLLHAQMTQVGTTLTVVQFSTSWVLKAAMNLWPCMLKSQLSYSGIFQKAASRNCAPAAVTFAQCEGGCSVCATHSLFS